MALEIKIADLLKTNSSFTFSFEVTPDVTKIDIYKIDLQPTFYSITWHAISHQCKDLEIAPLKLANFLRQSGKHVLLHLSCNLMKKEYLNVLLLWLQAKGICNLFIILGESFDSKLSDFHTSQEMIAYIRETTRDYFCIGVAGFPSSEHKISTLKQKVDHGADFIISQAIFEANTYKEFIKKCKHADINVPIIPGLFPFQSEGELKGFFNLCKVEVTDEFKDKLKKGTINGIDVVKKLIIELHDELHVKHFHFFTLNNLVRTCDVIKKIKLT